MSSVSDSVTDSPVYFDFNFSFCYVCLMQIRVTRYESGSCYLLDKMYFNTNLNMLTLNGKYFLLFSSLERLGPSLEIFSEVFFKRYSIPLNKVLHDNFGKSGIFEAILLTLS